MPEAVKIIKLEAAAAELASLATNFAFRSPLGEIEKLLPGVSGTIDVDEIAKTFSSEVANKIKQQVKAGTEESLTDALSTVKALREFLDPKNSIETILGNHYIGPEAYKDIFGVKDVGVVPPIPASVTPELLYQRCSLVNDGRTVLPHRELEI